MIAVVGYASVDRTLHLDRLPAPGVTARVLSAALDGSLRPGGIGHTVVALAAGIDDEIVPVCAVGDDEPGGAFSAALAEAGCRIDGIVALPGRSPTAKLLHDQDGGTACLFDPGVEWTGLSTRQRDLVTTADAVVVMIGPPAVMRDTVTAAPSEARLAWVVKNDPAALLPDVVAGLGERADIIFHNVAESPVVERLTGDTPILVRTDGAGPVTVMSYGSARSYAIERLSTMDNPTGAGDAFAGGYLAAWLGSSDEAACVAAGAAAARRRVETPA